jgi:formylglycine-generating enzyme required for sulfatase activity
VTIKAGKQHKITLQLDQSGTHLTVNTTPSQARVRIMNIDPPYEPGMKLEAGSYRIEVSARGYETVDKWIQVSGGNHEETVELKQERQNSVVSSLGLEFVDIPAGSFQMGSKEGEGDSDEHPDHRVSLSAFKMMKYEVTQGQWQAVMGSNPSYYASCGSDCPVEQVSWDDIQGFIEKLNAKTGQKYRLPAEAEWEYAAKAGSTTKYSFGNSENGLCDYGNGADKSAKRKYSDWTANENCDDGYVYTAPIGSFKPNAFGLYDMHGNVWEWTQDCYHDSYKGAPRDGSAWESGDCSVRVLRGGSWSSTPAGLRSANRDWNSASDRVFSNGFRLVQGR